MHDCANHVRHEEYGLGQTIPTMHTLEEDEDGNGYVTHYDVMFQGEDGPFIIEDVWVEDLEIISEKHHGHPKGKKKMSEDVEAIDEKKGHKKDKGDMDGDGIDEPDDKEYMDNKDKAIKAAMSKKKSESPIKKVQEGFTPIGKSGEHNVHHTDSSDLNFKSRHASKVSHGGKGSDEAGENQQHYKFKDHKIDINDNHTNTKLSHVQQRVKASGVDPKHHDAVSKSIHKHITAESVEIEEADQAAFANRRAQVAKQRQDRQAQIDKQRQAKQSDFAKRRAGINEAPKYIPGFMGADGKPTSKPTQKDYDSNKEYQHMKRKLGDRIPGPPAKKINKEHLESISTALQEISKKTLQNYVGKAKEDMAHHQNVQRAADKGNVPKSDPAVQFHKKEEKKRKVGMDRAKNRLAKESNEYTDDLADRIRSHENKKERKKAEKAFTAGDYEKATGHIGGTYREK